MTKNVLQWTKENQNLPMIFASLSRKKKEEYLVDQYGTVKWTTWFFDYRFRKHVHSVKDFEFSDWVHATVCVVCHGGSYESGWGDMSNYVMVIIGDKKYKTKSFKYDDSSYGTNIFTWKTSKTQKWQTTKEYKDILSVTHDSAADVCTIVVDTPIGEQTIETNSSNTMSFDEALLGKLYVPTGVQMDDISATAAKEILSSLDLPENYDANDMYMQTLDLYKEEWAIGTMKDLLFWENNSYYPRSEAFKIPTQKPFATLDPYVQYVLDRYIQTSYKNKKFDDFFVCKKLISMLHSQDLKKMYIDQLFDLVKAYPNIGTIQDFVDVFVSELQWNAQEHYQQLFDASYMVMDISSSRDETLAFIDLLAAKKIENYQRLYDVYIKRWGALLEICQYWSDDGYMNDRKCEIQFFVDRGIDFGQDAFQEIDSLDAQQKVPHLKKILDRLKLWKEEYPAFVTEEIIKSFVQKNTANDTLDQYEYDTSSSRKKKEFATLREMLHEEYGVSYTDAFYELFYNSIEDEYIQTYLLEHDWLDKIAGHKILQIISQNEEIHAKTKCMWFDWFLDHGYAVDESLFQSAFLKMFENYSNDDLDTRRLYQEKYEFLRTDTIKEAYTRIADEGITDMYGYKHHQHIPYASLGAIKSLLQNFVTQETGKIGTASHVKDILQMFFERDDLTSEYASELATTLYMNGLHKQLKQFIESIGLKLDKSLILWWIQELLKKEELGTAEFLVNAAGLEERMMKHIIIMKLQKWWNISRENEKFIQNDDELKKLYTATQLNKLVTAGKLTKALDLAYQHDIVLTPDYFAKYRQWQVDRIEEAKQKKIAAEKQQQLEKEQRIQQSKELQSLFDAGNYLVDINRKRDQKFVFGWTAEEWPFILSQPLERHRDIVKAADRSDDQILGWWWIKVDGESKTVVLYASSGSYGAVQQEFHQLVLSIVMKQYSDYTVNRQ